MPSLLHLPTELVQEIASYLYLPKDLPNFARTRLSLSEACQARWKAHVQLPKDAHICVTGPWKKTICQLAKTPAVALYIENLVALIYLGNGNLTKRYITQTEINLIERTITSSSLLSAEKKWIPSFREIIHRSDTVSSDHEVAEVVTGPDDSDGYFSRADWFFLDTCLFMAALSFLPNLREVTVDVSDEPPLNDLLYQREILSLLSAPVHNGFEPSRGLGSSLMPSLTRLMLTGGYWVWAAPLCLLPTLKKITLMFDLPDSMHGGTEWPPSLPKSKVPELKMHELRALENENDYVYLAAEMLEGPALIELEGDCLFWYKVPFRGADIARKEWERKVITLENDEPQWVTLEDAPYRPGSWGQH